MKNYFKKFSIMFVIALAIIGVGAIQNGTITNAATIGQQLTSSESGWQRIDDRDNRIYYYDNFGKWDYPLAFRGTDTYVPHDLQKKGMIKVKFYGSKIRIITTDASESSRYDSNAIVKIDNKNVGYINSVKPSLINSILSFEKSDLTFGTHTLEIDANFQKIIHLDAIDIDDTGYLINPNESISLDKTEVNLNVNNSQQLTATTTPSGSEVVWTSSDTSVATVDATGKVTAIKKGQAIITAQIKGSETKATCEVTVPKGTNPPVDEPTTGDGTLYIEMVDGNIKQAQNLDVSDFIKWFKNRDLDDNDDPIYKIKNAKGNVEYLVHDKVVGFEVR